MARVEDEYRKWRGQFRAYANGLLSDNHFLAKFNMISQIKFNHTNIVHIIDGESNEYKSDVWTIFSPYHKRCSC